MQMNGNDQNVLQVRQTLKSVLAQSPWYLSQPLSQQVEIYRGLLASGLENIQSGALVPSLAGPQENQPTTLRDVPELAGAFLDEVQFTDFVKDLITGVYGSIVTSTIEQMDAYIRMFKELAKPIGAIAREVDDIDAKSEVAANNPFRFTMTGSGDLTDNDTGMEIDESNDEYQRLLFEAKLKIAQERRLLLREAMLMGVQRLVVDRGTIRAGLVFNVRAGEQSENRRRETDITQTGGQSGGSFFGLFGGGSSKRRTNIRVSTSQINRQTELTAQITGHVEVIFSSDRFNLNNFAELFGNENTRAELGERQIAGGQPVAVPQPAAPRPAPAPVR